MKASKALAALLPKAPHAGEKWLALTAIVWGAWLLLPMDTFAAGFGRTLLGQVAGENVWGVVAIAIGANALIVSYQEWPRIRIVANLLLTAMWVFLGCSTLVSASAPLYLMLGLRHATFVYDSILDWRGAAWENHRR